MALEIRNGNQKGRLYTVPCEKYQAATQWITVLHASKYSPTPFNIFDKSDNRFRRLRDTCDTVFKELLADEWELSSTIASHFHLMKRMLCGMLEFLVY